jgi:40-residue YVTN family beta-propeller repeat
MYKENELIKIIAVSILLLFSASVFSIMDHEYGSGKSASPSSISGNISNTDIAPAAQNSSQNNSAGFVKYTIVLSNNTLINGNFINGQFANTSNGQIPFGVAFDSANGYIYITNIGSNNVWVINGATNKVIANISVGKHPQGGPLTLQMDIFMLPMVDLIQLVLSPFLRLLKNTKHHLWNRFFSYI